MEQRKTLIVTGVILSLIILIIVGTIIYLVKTLSPSTQTVTSTNPSGGLIIASPQPSTTFPSSSSTPSNLKVYTGQGFSVAYPSNWGLLTCNNSANFELDPTNSANSLKVSCDSALKPVTVIVGPASCQGEAVKLGSNQVVRSRSGSGSEISYRWCVAGNPNLDITHRVSSTGSRATSSNDYSQQIEQIISHITYGTGGS